MTKRAIFNGLMRGGTSATVPFWEVWFGKAAMLAKRYGPADRIESRIQMAEELGMAALPVGGANLNTGFAERDEASDGTSHYAGGALSSVEQLEARELPDVSAQAPELTENLRKLNNAGIAGILYLPWCFHTIATGMGLANFALAVCERPDFVQTCMHWVEERNRYAIRNLVKAVKPDLVLFDGDCAFKNGLMVSPETFRMLVFEETKATVALLRDLDIPYAFHTDGKLDDVIPVLVDLGFAAVHGCEKQANDLDHLVDTFGDHICLVGNMDVVFLSQATPDAVRRETEDMLRRGARKGRFIAACNTSPLDYIPDENYLAMCDTVKHFAG